MAAQSKAMADRKVDSRMSEITSRNAAADNIVIMMNSVVWSDTDTTGFSGFQKTQSAVFNFFTEDEEGWDHGWDLVRFSNCHEWVGEPD